MSSFEGENMQTQYNVLGYRIELYFDDYKLAMSGNTHFGGNFSSVNLTEVKFQLAA